MTDTVVPAQVEGTGPALPPPPGQAPAAPVPVDNPKLPAPGVVDEKRKPIVPAWLRDRAEFDATTRHAAGRLGYASLYHGVRLPWYGLQLAKMSPRGACRFVAATGRWVWDREAAPLRAHAVRMEDADCSWPGCAATGSVCAAWSPSWPACSVPASPCGCTSWPRRSCGRSRPAGC
jgi:S-DNA-T family DNA segregation ATPase FtsK/SpoIIIE